MTRSRATPAHTPDALMATYYSQRATAGLIITEGTSPSPNGLGYPRIPGLYDKAQVDAWKAVTAAVHAQGGKIFVQLMHCGRMAHYPEFLPWCAEATVLSRNDTGLSARITVGHGDLRFDFVTRNTKRRAEFMVIHLEKGPFRRFEGEWHLFSLGVDACKIEFALRYEFDNPVIAALAGPGFGQMVDTLVDAFVRRADKVSCCGSQMLTTGSQFVAYS